MLLVRSPRKAEDFGQADLPHRTAYVKNKKLYLYIFTKTMLSTGLDVVKGPVQLSRAPAYHSETPGKKAASSPG